MEVAMVEVAAKAMVVLMALNLNARMVISNFFSGKSNNSVEFFIFNFIKNARKSWLRDSRMKVIRIIMVWCS